MSVRYYTSYKDLLEMKVGDRIDRILPKGIDKFIGPTCNRCAIAMDIWQDRSKEMIKRPVVSSKQNIHDVSIYPKQGIRYDLDFTSEAVCQITELSDMGESVEGLDYGLKLINIVNVPIPSKEKKEKNKKLRLSKTNVYEEELRVWIDGGRDGPEPKKPSHMKAYKNGMAERVKLVNERHPDGLPEVDPHVLMRRQRRLRSGRS